MQHFYPHKTRTFQIARKSTLKTPEYLDNFITSSEGVYNYFFTEKKTVMAFSPLLRNKIQGQCIFQCTDSIKFTSLTETIH